MKRTDKNNILWPKRTAHAERSQCRRIINAIRDALPACKAGPSFAVFSCSAGMDSTVLAHAASMAIRVSGKNILGILFYCNHMLRPDEVKNEINFVRDLSAQLGFEYQVEACPIQYKNNNNLQADARQQRYSALYEFGDELALQSGWYHEVNVFTAHHANDVAETKLFNFITGRSENGIREIIEYPDNYNVIVKRPLLSFSKLELKKYAEVWGLEWCEDSSNSRLKYTRNKIRHELLPWIEKNINPAIVKTLSKETEK